MTNSLSKRRAHPEQTGFSLLEISISLLVLGLLAQTFLPLLSGQLRQQARQQTEQQLNLIMDSLIGFAQANGRLPCPANEALSHQDPAAGQEACPREHGVIPWVTLGVSETDAHGHRFTYFASKYFSTPGFTLDTIGNGNIDDSAGKRIASDLAAVVIAHGLNPAGSYTRLGEKISSARQGEAENSDADTLFICHSETPEFDDQCHWLSTALLKSRLVSAGRLP